MNVNELVPPPGWRDRDEAGRYRRAITRMAYGEAAIARAQERLKVAAPQDDDWETLFEWEDEAYELLAVLGAATRERDRAGEEVLAILRRWYEQDAS